MKRLWGVLAFVVCVTTIPGTAEALYRTNKVGDLDISGRLRSTNLVRHPSLDRLSFIMQRNELKMRFEWKFLKRGKAFGRWKIPWLQRADFFAIYRGIYDSVYDITPGMVERKDLQGDPITARQASLESIPESRRNEFKFYNQFREAYVDLYFKKLPLTLRIGKQQVVWGESDGFRMLDRANTLDLSWHFFQELPPPGFGFDELRIPFFMIKGLWDFRQLGPLAQPFLEFYWNPGDWQPGKISFLPRPWGVRLLDPMVNTAGTGALQSQVFCRDADGGQCAGLMDGTKLFRQGNYGRNPLDNSQFGVRFHFITPGGVEMTLNYLYQRWSPDGSPTAIVRGLPAGGFTRVADASFLPGNQPANLPNDEYCRGLSNPPGSRQAPWGRNQLCLQYFAPYIHTIGYSANWFEGNYTQTVWRLETIIDFDLPFYDGDKQVALFGRSPNGAPLIPGISNKNMWKGMLAFDRPTWIRWLNKQTTFFVTGQFFWHYLINNERRRCSINDQPKRLADGSLNPDFVGFSAGENCGSDTELLLPGEQMGLIGPLDLPKIDRPTDAKNRPRLRDTIHQWELLGTLAVLGFYRGGSLVPALIYLVDPVNSFSQEVAFGIDWYVRPDIAVNFTTRLIWVGLPWDAYAGHKGIDDPNRGQIFDPWFLGGASRGRSESGIMFTWQF